VMAEEVVPALGSSSQAASERSASPTLDAEPWRKRGRWRRLSCVARDKALARGRSEMAELLATGKVGGYQGHHINSVSAFPQLAADPDNIKFVRRGAEHIGEHASDYRNASQGPLMRRQQ
jgi:hypothetical protein